MSLYARTITFVAVWSVIALLVSGALPTRAQDEPDVLEQYKEAGLSSESAYASPTYGYEVEWTTDWTIAEGQPNSTLVYSYAIDTNQDVPVYSDPGAGRDRLDLWNDAAGGRVRVIAQSTTGAGVRRHAEILAQDYPGQALGGSAEVLLATEVNAGLFGIVHRHHQADGSTLLAYSEVSGLGGEEDWLWTQVSAPEVSFADAYLAALEGVAIDGAGIDGVFTPDDILSAADSDTDYTTPADVGITSPTTYESPQYRFTIEWAPDWAMYGGAGTGANNRSNTGNGWDQVFLRYQAGDPDFTIVSVNGQANVDGLTLREILSRNVAETSKDEREVLIADVVGETGVILSRKVYEDGSGNVEYSEFALVGDGASIAEARIVADPEDFAFTYTHAAGSVSIQGRPLGEAFTVDEILAAAAGDATASVLAFDRLLAIKARSLQAETYVEDYGDAGMTWANTYESPTYGYEVEWSSDWLLNEIDGEAPVTSDEDGVESLMIVEKKSGSRLEITTMPMADATVEGLIETIEDACADASKSSCEVLLAEGGESSGGIIVEEFNDQTNTNWATYHGFSIADDGESVQGVSLSVPTSIFDIGYERVLTTVTIDGEPIDLAFDLDDVPGDD